MVRLPKLGVGITFFSGIEPILEENIDLIDVLEIEPQTIWRQKNIDSNEYLIDERTLKSIQKLDVTKTLHSVGLPIGSTHLPDPEQILLLQQMISEFNTPWMSEHLSFNHANNNNKEFFTGFLLPPRQTRDGVESSVKSINSLKNSIPIPLAIEVGVNYLKPRKDELSDGQFISAVSKNADCGILLDLHNVWTNSLNGRQTISEFIDQIPLERVWEVHVAGGFEDEGYWLDAHSGEIPKPLFNLAKKIIPRLPNLSAIIFELFPSYLPQFGSDRIRSQLQHVHELWNLRNQEQSPIIKTPTVPKPNNTKTELSIPNSQEWENVLGSLVTYQDVDGLLAKELSQDQAINLYRKLIHSFRASMIIRTLKITSRLLKLSLGKKSFNDLLEDYFKKCTPKPFASSEAKQFAHYIRTKQLDISDLDAIIKFELSVISTLLDHKHRIVNFNHEPIVILKAITENRLPNISKKGNFEIEITSETIEELNEKQKLNEDLSWQSIRWHH